MRRRRVRGADQKLLSYKDYIVNGMVDQILEKHVIESSNSESGTYKRPKSNSLRRNIDTSTMGREDLSITWWTSIGVGGRKFLVMIGQSM